MVLRVRKHSHEIVKMWWDVTKYQASPIRRTTRIKFQCHVISCDKFDNVHVALLIQNTNTINQKQQIPENLLNSKACDCAKARSQNQNSRRFSEQKLWDHSAFSLSNESATAIIQGSLSITINTQHKDKSFWVSWKPMAFKELGCAFAQNGCLSTLFLLPLVERSSSQ